VLHCSCDLLFRQTACSQTRHPAAGTPFHLRPRFGSTQATACTVGKPRRTARALVLAMWLASLPAARADAHSSCSLVWCAAASARAASAWAAACARAAPHSQQANVQECLHVQKADTMRCTSADYHVHSMQ